MVRRTIVAAGSRARSRDPLVGLGVGAALVVALDAGRLARSTPEYPWLIAEAVVAACALLLAWQGQDRLRFRGLLVVAALFQAAMVAVYLALGDLPGRSEDLYAEQGQMLLDGGYPESEYPTGAVLLFALETAVGGGSAHAANAIMMVAFQVLVVAGVWAMRTPWSAWLAALIAFWPFARNYWDQTFDLVPAALLVWGLVFAWRERFWVAGALLGLGAVVKWVPALSVAALVVWLLASGRARDGGRLAAAGAGVFALLTLPFLAWSPDNVAAAYTEQGGRTIIGESLPYLPLHWLGQATVVEDFTHAADVPSWADPVASIVQLVVVAATLVLAALVRGRLASAIAVAALVPVVFLLVNRVFSAQFLLLVLPAWALAIALLARSRREQLMLGVAAAVAGAANAFVYPFGLPGPLSWEACSAMFFAIAIALSAWLLVRAWREGPVTAAGAPQPR